MVANVQARGPHIRRKREETGHGLNNFAQAIGVSPSHLSRIERRISEPSPEVLKRIADGLGTDLSEVTEHEEEATTDERPPP